MKLKTDTINVAATPTQQSVPCRWLVTLLVFLMTTATAWAGQKPVCCLDVCRGEACSIYVSGWAYDPDARDYGLNVKVYVYTDAACQNQYAYKKLTTGNVERPDVEAAHNLPSGSKPGFAGRISIQEPGTYYVKVYAIDINEWGDDVANSSTQMSHSFNPVTVTTITTIGSAEEWNQFVTAVNAGMDFSDKTVTLTADIPTAEEIAAGTTAVTTMTSENKAFCGTFDGQGHTINVDLNTSGVVATGLFSYVKGATINDLTVTGAINNNDMYAGGLVGTAKGATIQDCTFAATITSSSDTEIGAFVGSCVQIDADTPGYLTLQNCVFSGAIEHNSSFYSCKAAGLVSVWSNTSLNIDNCLVAGSFTSTRPGSQFYPIAFKDADATVTATVSDTYYLNTLPATTSGSNFIADAEGTAVSTTETEEYFIPVTAADGNTYYKQQKCGVNAWWKLVPDDGDEYVLEIGGSDSMNDYDGSNMPWYDQMGNITGVTIGEGVTYIGDNAFNGCGSLRTVTLNRYAQNDASPITTIGEDVFYDCDALEHIIVPISGLDAYNEADNWTDANMNTLLAATGTTETKEQQEVTWTLKPNGTIGDPSHGEVEQTYALTINAQQENTTIEFEPKNCPWKIYEDYINSITIVGAKYIGNNAFQSYQNLTTLCITDDPDDSSFQLSEIRERAFSQCPKLTTVRLNMDALPVLGEKVFDECPALTVIIVPAEVFNNIIDVDGWTDELKAKLGFGGTFMAEYDEDVELAWTLQPNGKLLDEYGHETDETTYALTIEAIGEIRNIFVGSGYPWESFKYNITSITIQGAETIGNNVFDDYINLTKLSIADVDNENIHLLEIDSYAFSSCPKLTTVLFRVGSLPVLNEDAFYYCDALMRIIVPAEIFKDSEEINVEGWTDDLKSMLCMGGTFMAGDEEDVELFWTLQPNGYLLDEHGHKSDETSYALTIEVSGSNRNISFDSDSDIPWESYQTVITSISIMGAETIGDNAFHNYENLTTVYLANNPNEDSFSLLRIDGYAFSSCDNLTTVRLNVSDLPKLGNDAFGSYDALTQIVVPAEVYEYVQDTDVDGWTDELKAKLCVGGVCGKNGINDARVAWMLTDADGDGTAETLTIEGMGEMADFYAGETPWYAFKTDITRVIIGYGVRSIGEYAFQGCTNLAMMIICGNEMQNSEYGYVQLNNANALDGCAALTHIIVPLDTYYDEGTWDDDDLQEIIFHGGFCGKNGVRGDNMVWIMTDDSDHTLNIEGKGAMADYEDADDVPWDLWTVKNVVVGDEVTTIGINAFYAYGGNTSVITIRMKGETPPTLPEGALDELQELAVIAVPPAAISTYKDADGWRAYADKIKGGLFLPPTQLAAEMTDFETITVTWSAPKTFSTVTGYAYQYKKADEEEWPDEETITGTTVNLTGLTYGANYQFRVKTLYEGDEASAQYATVSFDAMYYFKKPTNLAVSGLTDEEATISWEAPESAYDITGYAYHFRRNDEEDWSATTTVGASTTSATVSGLAANKVYVFGVTALYEDGYASSDETLSFTTNVSLPYEDSFENGIGGWSVYGFNGTGIHEQDDYTHSGSHGFKFAKSYNEQYLTVPLPDFGVPIRVSFYYKNYNDGQLSYRSKFQVGYSTDPSARYGTFTWGDEIMSSNLWKLFTADFPAGTTAVGIKWADGYDLYIDDFSIRSAISFAIADKADNTAIFVGKDGYQGDVTLQGRTLWTDNEWNTLCLPFSMTAQQIADSPLAHAVIRELDAETSNLTDGTLTLNFKKALSLAAGKPYIVKWAEGTLVIRSKADWEAFATSVAEGTNYYAKTVILDTDLTVTEMVKGFFTGTFDGNGHTITLDIDYTESTSGVGQALFYQLRNATVKNLQTEGWVTTSGHRPANIAVYADGTSTISNCTCGASIESTLKRSWVDGGGVVACIKSGATLNMTDCYFRGSIYYDETAYSGGGMVGWTEDATATANLERCVYNPAWIVIEKTDNDPHYFVSGPGQKTLNKCFYNNTAEESVLTAEGTSWEVYTNTEDLWDYLGWNFEDWNLPKEVAAASFTIESPVIESVTIDCDETPVVNFDGGQFVGSYSPVALPVNDRSNLFLGAKNMLYWPSATNYEDFPDLDGANSSNFYLGSCRAYFHIGSPSGVRAFVLNFDENEQTGIKTIFADDRKSGSPNAATGIYTLDGRLVATDFDKCSPYSLPKGVYIVNGRKVAIK